MSGTRPRDPCNAIAWVITVPLAGILGAMFFFMMRGMLLP